MCLCGLGRDKVEDSPSTVQMLGCNIGPCFWRFRGLLPECSESVMWHMVCGLALGVDTLERTTVNSNSLELGHQNEVCCLTLDPKAWT